MLHPAERGSLILPRCPVWEPVRVNPLLPEGKRGPGRARLRRQEGLTPPPPPKRWGGEGAGSFLAADPGLLGLQVGGTLLQTLTGSSQTSSPLVHLLQQHHIPRCLGRHPCPTPGLGTGGVLRSWLTPRLTLLAPVCSTPVTRCTLVPHDWTVCVALEYVVPARPLPVLCSVPLPLYVQGMAS